MATSNAEDGMRKYQWVKSKLQLGVRLFSKAGCVVYDIKGFDIALGKRWIWHIHYHYQIVHVSHAMWLANTVRKRGEKCKVHYLPAQHPLDVADGIVEQLRFMAIHSMQEVELKYVVARQWNGAILIEVHNHCDCGTLETDKPPGEFQVGLTELQGLFCEPTYANSHKERQTIFSIITDQQSKIQFCSQFQISLCKVEKVWRQKNHLISCDGTYPSASYFGSPGLFMAHSEWSLHMCIDYGAVIIITVEDHCSLAHIDDLLNSMHSSWWFATLNLVAVEHLISITKQTGNCQPLWLNFVCSRGDSCHVALHTQPAHSCAWWFGSWNQRYTKW